MLSPDSTFPLCNIKTSINPAMSFYTRKTTLEGQRKERQPRLTNLDGQLSK